MFLKHLITNKIHHSNSLFEVFLLIHKLLVGHKISELSEDLHSKSCYWFLSLLIRGDIRSGRSEGLGAQ